MKIPTFEEAKQALIEKRGTPLDRFIHELEPAGNKDEQEWRDMLENVLSFAQGKIHHAVAEGIVEESNELQKRLESIPDIERLDRCLLFNSFWNPSTNQYEEKK